MSNSTFNLLSEAVNLKKRSSFSRELEIQRRESKPHNFTQMAFNIFQFYEFNEDVYNKIFH